jgi:hypothetical protein
VCIKAFSGLDAIASRLVLEEDGKGKADKKGNYFRDLKDEEDQYGFPYRFYNRMVVTVIRTNLAFSNNFETEYFDNDNYQWDRR